MILWLCGTQDWYSSLTEMPSPTLIVFEAFTSVHQLVLLCNYNIAVCHFQGAYVFQEDSSQFNKHSK